MKSESPRVQYFATIAAGHLGNALQEILRLLEQNDNEDVYLRHAGVVALANSQSPEQLMGLSSHQSQAVRLGTVLALRKHQSPLVTIFLQDEDLAVATEAARAIHDVPMHEAMESLALSIANANGMPWQRRAISACKRLSMNAKQVALFAADTNNAERMRKVAIDTLRSWSAPFPRREIVEGRIVYEVNDQPIEEIGEEVRLLVANSEGELLANALGLARTNGVTLPEELMRSLLEDDLQPIALREYCLRDLQDDQAIAYGLQHQSWQLRSTARDIMFEQGSEEVVPLLFDAINSSVVYEGQAAVTTLAKDQLAFAKIDKNTLPIGVQLEYAIAVGEPNAFGEANNRDWLQHGGDPTVGKQVVFNNPQSQCIRCHKIDKRGGISGPILAGVATRLTTQQLQDSLLLPNKDVTDGYGEYSTMPPMGVLLDYRDLRDVIAYLKTLKTEQ
jgi:HEAT repeat protein